MKATLQGNLQKALCTSALVAVGLTSVVTAPSIQAGQRPLEDFLSRQGTYVPPGFESWPAWTFFYGWLGPDVPYSFAFDYAGVASRWLEENSGLSFGATFNGFINEKALPDGSAEVTILVQARNALTWANAVQGNPTETPILFGYRPNDIAQGAPATLGSCTLQVKLINPLGVGQPLPDLESPDYQLLFLAFVGQAQGPLRAAFGVPDGTPGFIQTRQTGLLTVAGRANPNSRVAWDAFPAEKLIIRAIGR